VLAQRLNFDPTESRIWFLLLACVVVIVMFMFVVAVLAYGKLWFQAYMSNARVSMLSLVGMSLRQVNARVILQAKIMAMQAGVAATAALLLAPLIVGFIEGVS
jgi:uncharacterized protein YqfA (UPF0365 family)